MVTTDSSYIAVAQNASRTVSVRPIMLRFTRLVEGVRGARS
jgi:hypothetical protein